MFGLLEAQSESKYREKAGRRLIMDVTYVLQRGVWVWTGHSLAAGSKLGVEASR
jgi:hypothetical protein